MVSKELKVPIPYIQLEPRDLFFYNLHEESFGPHVKKHDQISVLHMSPNNDQIMTPHTRLDFLFLTSVISIALNSTWIGKDKNVFKSINAKKYVRLYYALCITFPNQCNKSFWKKIHEWCQMKRILTKINRIPTDKHYKHYLIFIPNTSSTEYSRKNTRTTCVTYHAQHLTGLFLNILGI